ncbi:hypothetical protein FQN49_005203 [Arthroderma sp. PD_2]|nr:hypothetical protein FQN49_005203 [Arthroderma sp. PD_2]
MSFIARRGISTLIPPKIASPSAIGAAKDAARMERVSDFYARLLPAPEVKPSGLFARYQAAYFGKNASSAREFSRILAFRSPYTRSLRSFGGGGPSYV